MLYVMMGKSASGKDTLYRALMEDEEMNLRTFVPYTTRPLREGETEGKEYHFVSVEQMKEMEQQGRVIERRTYHTMQGEWNYFTVHQDEADLQQEDYLIIGTLETYEKLRNYYGRESVMPLYIEVEDGVRLARALERERLQREPGYAEMCRRFLADSDDFREENLKKMDIAERFSNQDSIECITRIKLFILGNRN